MFAGIYYGVAYGGTITSVLINVPGESSTVMTCIDGYQMALKGRAGAALSVAAVGSWIAGTISVAILMCFAPALAKFALRFGPAEFFGLAFMSFGLLTVFGADEPIKTILSTLIGLFIATIGLDVVSGMPRFAFGIPQLLGGFDFIVIICGIFGLAEVFNSIEEPEEGQLIKGKMRLRDLFVSKAEWIASRWAILRGGIIGFLIGLSPPEGSRQPPSSPILRRKGFRNIRNGLGKGPLRGCCTRGCEQCRFDQRVRPLLALGIQGLYDAVMLAGFMMWGFSRPSALSNQTRTRLGTHFKQVHREPHPPPDEHLSHPLFVMILRVPYTILMCFIVIFASVGAFTVNNNIFDVWMMLGFGVLGYIMKKLNYPIVPLVLALVLGIWQKILSGRPWSSPEKPLGPRHTAHFRPLYHCRRSGLPQSGDPLGD